MEINSDSGTDLPMAMVKPMATKKVIKKDLMKDLKKEIEMERRWAMVKPRGLNSDSKTETSSDWQKAREMLRVITRD